MPRAVGDALTAWSRPPWRTGPLDALHSDAPRLGLGSSLVPHQLPITALMVTFTTYAIARCSQLAPTS
jgi:hypothetical protein